MRGWQNSAIKQHGQKGFTLVELAIVLTIIGLLIGGILKGQQLIENSRITGTIVQVKSYQAGMIIFRDTYGSLPGDMMNASLRVRGCNANCDASTGPPGLERDFGNNGIIGRRDWSTFGANWQTQGTVTNTPPGAGNAAREETYLFWAHLTLAGLITGVTRDGIISGIPYAWKITHPLAKIDGGFLVGYGDGNIGPGSLQPANTGITGNMIVMVVQPGVDLQTATGTLPLTPHQAAQIDRKFDDGNPASGDVQAYGVGASCFTTNVALVYAETLSRKDCGLMIALGG